MGLMGLMVMVVFRVVVRAAAGAGGGAAAAPACRDSHCMHGRILVHRHMADGALGVAGALPHPHELPDAIVAKNVAAWECVRSAGVLYILAGLHSNGRAQR